MAEKPGVILYYDMYHPLRPLSYEEKGRLLEAVMEYAEFGVLPELEGLLEMAWGFLRPRLDLDAKKYRMKVAKAAYSSYCGVAKREGLVPLDLEAWKVREGIDEEWNYTRAEAASGSVRWRSVADGIQL